MSFAETEPGQNIVPGPFSELEINELAEDAWNSVDGKFLPAYVARLINERFAPEYMDELYGRLEADERFTTDAAKQYRIVRGDDPYAELARKLEYEGFLKSFKNKPKMMDKEYGPYDPDSMFALALDRNNRSVCGVLRIILDNNVGLKTLHDVSNPDKSWKADMVQQIEEGLAERTGGDLEPDDLVIDPVQLLDIGTVNVPDAYQKGPLKDPFVSAMLYHTALRFTEDNGYRHWVTIIDERPMRKINLTFAQPLERVKGLEAAAYLDSPKSIPMHLDVLRYFRRVSRDRPDLYSFLHDGIDDPNYDLPKVYRPLPYSA